MIYRHWGRRPQHLKMTEAEKQEVFALAHDLPEHIYGPIGFHPSCHICNPTGREVGHDRR